MERLRDSSASRIAVPMAPHQAYSSGTKSCSAVRPNASRSALTTPVFCDTAPISATGAPTGRPFTTELLKLRATASHNPRNPATGEKAFYGEFLENAQGEDVVAGIRTPHPISDLEKWNAAVYNQLKDITTMLEQHYRDIQDFEFTIQDGKLYMLQTRNGKRTGPAAVRIAVEMVGEGLISKEEAILRVDPQQLDQLLHPVLDPASKKTLVKLAIGLPASPGAAVGQVTFPANDAVVASQKAPIILVRKETVPDRS